MPQHPSGYITPFYINYVFPSIYDNSGDEYSGIFKDYFLLTEPFNVGAYEQFSAANLHTLKMTASNKTMKKLENKYIHLNRRYRAVLATRSIFSEYEFTLLYDVEELLYYFPVKELT